MSEGRLEKRCVGMMDYFIELTSPQYVSKDSAMRELENISLDGKREH